MLRAMINDPDILILDEPSRGLDLTSREEVLSAMETLFKKKQGVSIIYVTHHTDEIIPIFNKILILKEGKTFFRGDVGMGLKSQVLSEVFEQDIDILRIDGRYYTVVRSFPAPHVPSD
jgi:iron complex transport system ATP-binding protein